MYFIFLSIPVIKVYTIKYMLRKIPHLLVVTFIFSFVQIAYAGACPFVTPEVPICPESGHIYECGNPPQAEAAFFDFMGQETRVCGQCVDVDLGMGGVG